MTDIARIDKQTVAAKTWSKPGEWGRRGTALMALGVAAIPAALTALLVWVSLGRPLLFRQLRTGLEGRTFTVVKFRTMKDLRDGEGQLLPDRLRETAITRLVRLLRLDEIPQLLAILNGHMNFIGPRPLQPWTVAQFGPLGVLRNQVRPGLTGWAQVNGNTRLSDTDKLALDIWYIENRSRVLDAWILVLTLVTLLRGERVGERQLAMARERLAARSMSANRSARTAGGGET
ncbi:sugar transferase [Chelativorans sp. M5D2P16]|uniref:sugar transferase n=1 Tax=Chelativorans sp. M5D2P16 TaxID=3095678 RepID=UPI002ACAA4D3|nr:sugar transferase [Chelativorans sp. M5D2P16]MDZ5696493.1 sugar transferase [Chelativorans sp. M5D2P16]